MSQVSKRVLGKQAEVRILDLLWISLSMLSTKQEITLFLDDFLTPTEKMMLAKRLTIAFMLIKGYGYPMINNRIKVSDQTIWNIKAILHHRGKGYKNTIKKIMEKENWEKFWNEMDHFFERLIPPRPGTNWKEVRRKQWEKRRSIEKPF